MKKSLLAFLLINSAVQAQTFESGAAQVPLIELFTSQGCSSCPPADRWMSNLLNQEGLWQEFVPVAFHVDYWDYIGWEDRFADHQYSQRQRRYAAEFGESTVYTPGMRKAGGIWRDWVRNKAAGFQDATQVGTLRLTVSERGLFTASFDPVVESTDSAQINIALLGLDLETPVTRGENKGKTLQHNFVVLGLTTIAGVTTNRWQGSLPLPTNTAQRYAVAAWVTKGGSLKPIQSTGGLLYVSLIQQ